MKLWITILLLFVSSDAFCWGVKPFSESPYDHISHATVAAIGTTYGHHFLSKNTSLNSWQSRLIASSVSFMVVGIGKEISDKNWSNGDLTASGIGAVIGAGFTFEF